MHDLRKERQRQTEKQRDRERPFALKLVRDMERDKEKLVDCII